MRKYTRRLLKAVLFVGCCLLLGFMVWKAGPLQLWHTLCSTPGTIALCILVWAVGYLLNAAAFRHVLIGTGARLSYLATLGVTISGYALNYITPFGLLGGEPYRVWVLKRSMGTEKATQGVVLYSMMHIASHFLFWILAAFVALATATLTRGQDRIGWDETLWVAGLMLACLLLLFLFWRLYRRGIALKFMSRWVNWSLLDPSLLPSGRFIRALLLELSSRLVNVIEYWLVMQALGYPSFGYFEALLVVAFSSLLANILFFSPMQVGTREGGILLALQYLLSGHLLPVALTLSFATRIREFFWIAVGLAIMKRK
ncbi:MAG: flippase-like domain-containing protein [Bacteroidales bacterium]|nr:flippase-like domain-containing protein [Bacteroidales bacterium]